MPDDVTPLDEEETTPVTPAEGPAEETPAFGEGDGAEGTEEEAPEEGAEDGEETEETPEEVA